MVIPILRSLLCIHPGINFEIQLGAMVVLYFPGSITNRTATASVTLTK
jgi:hypothetical protein